MNKIIRATLFSILGGAVLFFIGVLENRVFACDLGLYLRGDWLVDQPKFERVLSPGSYRDLYVHLNQVPISKLKTPKVQGNLRQIRHTFPNARIQGWLGISVCDGRKKSKCVNIENPGAQKQILGKVREIWAAGFDGAHLDLEPISGKNPSFLLLLRKIQESKSSEKILSLAGMSLSLSQEMSEKIHVKPRGSAKVFFWNESDYRSLLPLVDQIMVMNYDTALRKKAEYVLFTQFQTEVLSRLFHEAKNKAGHDVELRLGVPVYQHGRSGVFDPLVENLQSAIEGVGLVWKGKCPKSAGLAVFIEDEFNAFDQQTLKNWSKDSSK